ncbi:MAG: 4-hydroxybenzoate polyprenyltransferase [Arcobacter butzleri]|jgi:4-hydroxybenzoate polyprenyltransferase|nr:4-hydroxybenzoate polyprenyltransferase [Arcobacteraceae bacterium]MDY0365069.1 menaquinone biosynthesis prenyltransferase MqnP [Arcobacteraceae bacterium]NLO16959.1 4-hydroxybenzoate polyprenyltransferase [Aliarcobacter butzleri]
MNKIIKKLKDFSELVVFSHSIFSLPFIFIAMVVAANGWFGWKLLLLGLLAAVSARNFAMSINRYLDRDIDGHNPRTASRPNVDGRINANQILAFVIINALIFITVAYFVNTLAFILSVPILIVIGSYSYFKRFSFLAHIILGLSLGLAPIAGVVAVSESVYLWTIYLSIGVIFWVAGFDLLYSLQDIEIDKKLGLHSIPSKFGVNKTLWISKIFHSITNLMWMFFVIKAQLGLFAYIAVVFSALMLAYEHRIVAKDFNKIDKAFFTVNGYLGIVFFLLIVLDFIYKIEVPVT